MPIFHYVHAETGHHLASPLPPNHPEMICLQEGGHIKETHFGLLGKSLQKGRDTNVANALWCRYTCGRLLVPSRNWTLSS